MGLSLQAQCPAGAWQQQGTHIGHNQLLLRCWKEHTRKDILPETSTHKLHLT